MRGNKANDHDYLRLCNDSSGLARSLALSFSRVAAARRIPVLPHVLQRNSGFLARARHARGNDRKNSTARTCVSLSCAGLNGFENLQASRNIVYDLINLSSEGLSQISWAPERELLDAAAVTVSDADRRDSFVTFPANWRL